jgi:radical SAM superfamily enzyme YgiQ (UPF0313 family)
VNNANERKVHLLEEMGCRGFAFGVESGNEYIRNEILNKKASNEQIIRAFNLFKDSNIKLTANNIIGLPYESRKEIFDTIELNRILLGMNPGFRASVAIFNPYEGTKLKEICLKEGFISKDNFAKDYRGEIALDMPQISKKELLGLHRTFQLYLKFPKERWAEIEKAEQDDNEFKKLREEYIEKYMKRK